MPLGTRLTVILVSAWISGCKVPEMSSSSRQRGTYVNVDCSRRSNPSQHWGLRVMLCSITSTMAASRDRLETVWRLAERGRSMLATREAYRESGVEKVSGSWSTHSSSPFTKQRGRNPGQEEKPGGGAGIQLLAYPQPRNQVSRKWAIVEPTAKERVSVPSQEG